MAAEPPDFATVYDTQFDYVWHSLRSLGVSDPDLEDVAHDVFVTVFRRLFRYDPTRPLRPWLFGIALRVASDHRRAGRNRRSTVVDTDLGVEVAADQPSAEDRLMLADRRGLVNAALGAVDADAREVFVLHDQQEIPIPRIATSTGVRVNTLYARLRRARLQFTAAIKRLGGPVPSGI